MEEKSDLDFYIYGLASKLQSSVYTVTRSIYPWEVAKV